jgi:hypothetical protein
MARCSVKTQRKLYLYIHTYIHTYIQGPFEKFVDWRQCTAVMQREAMTYVVVVGQHSSVVLILLTIVRAWVTVILKVSFSGWWSNSVARLNSVFGLGKVDQNPYNSSIKPMETMQ